MGNDKKKFLNERKRRLFTKLVNESKDGFFDASNRSYRTFDKHDYKENQDTFTPRKRNMYRNLFKEGIKDQSSAGVHSKSDAASIRSSRENVSGHMVNEVVNNFSAGELADIYYKMNRRIDEGRMPTSYSSVLQVVSKAYTQKTGKIL